MGRDEGGERTLFVPLRSNAHGLLAGSSVARFRRQLKRVSLLYDEIYLEDGMLSINAGPTGSIVMPLPTDERPTFQTPRQRHISQGQRFSMSLGAEKVAGSEARELTTFLSSETSILWAPTLLPFIAEVGRDCDWIKVVRPQVSRDVKKVADLWKRRDLDSEALRRALPEALVRSLVVEHANFDLATGAHGGAAVMQDPIHQRVVAERFNEDAGWHASGFALPLLVPEVGDLDWSTVAALRRHRAMKDLRTILVQIEGEAIGDASSGDIERAVHRAFERHWQAAAGKFESLGTIPRTAVVELGIGTMTGLVTAGLVGPVAIAAGAGLGTAIASGRTAVSVLRARRRQGWLAAYSEVRDAVAHGM